MDKINKPTLHIPNMQCFYMISNSLSKLKLDEGYIEQWTDGNGSYIKFNHLPLSSPISYFKTTGDYIKGEGVVIKLTSEGKTEPNLIIPDGTVRVLDNLALNNNIIENAILPDTVEKLGSSAFANCQNLKYVKTSKKLKYLPYRCFFSCANLKKIEMFEGLESIGEINGFSNNQDVFVASGIEEITLPSTTYIIGRNSFNSCVNLRKFSTSAGIYGYGFLFDCSQSINITINAGNLDTTNSAAGAFAYNTPGQVNQKWKFTVNDQWIKTQLKDFFKIDERNISVDQNLE